jgi:hypothetical protein
MYFGYMLFCNKGYMLESLMFYVKFNAIDDKPYCSRTNLTCSVQFVEVCHSARFNLRLAIGEKIKKSY